jgi:TM2 domain-containing membrane protein YozV
MVQQAPVATAPKSKIAAGLFGIFLGGLGVHRFYLGYAGIGAAQLILSIVGLITLCFGVGIFFWIAAWLWGLIEGILILAGVIDKDAQGQPLAG